MADRTFWVEITTEGTKAPSREEICEILTKGLKKPGQGRSSFPVTSVAVGHPEDLMLTKLVRATDEELDS